MITVIGFFAGIVPVAIGMLWFPFIKSLQNRWVHAMLALSAGVLAFVAIEMIDEIAAYSRAVTISDGTLGSTSDGGAIAGLLSFLGMSAGTFLAVVLAIVAGVLTAGAMKWVGDWRREQLYGGGGEGLRVAYLIAIGLGFHSIGEGLAIGASFRTGAYSLLTLLVVGFVLHNVTEGLTVVAAFARDESRPSLWHFAAVGVIAGGPLILGGWIGILAYVPILAVIFLAIGVGAITEVIWEVAELVRMDAEKLLTLPNGASFALGLGSMFLLEDVIVEGFLL